jgi:hypothetical protein
MNLSINLIFILNLNEKINYYELEYFFLVKIIFIKIWIKIKFRFLFKKKIKVKIKILLKLINFSKGI